MASQGTAYPPTDYNAPPAYGGGPVVQQPVPMQTNTTVVIQQQAQNNGNIQMPRGWSSGLCGCFEDFGVCLAVMCCGECYSCCCFMTDVHESCCLPFCFPASWMAAVRTKIRTKYNIQGSVMDDFCMTSGCCACFTRPCVLCQMVREVKYMSSQGQQL